MRRLLDLHGGLLPPLAGGAYPTAPSSSTGPGELPEDEQPELWAELTERIELPQAAQAFAGMGESQVLSLERVGCPAQAEILIKVSFETAGSGEVKPTIGMPWAFLKTLAMKANGVAGVISCSGTVLEARQKVAYRCPEHAVVGTMIETPATSTEYTYEWVVQVPIAEDLKELDGIVLAQSEETALGLELTWATMGEAFAGTSSAAVSKVSGEVRWHIVLFSIGSTTEGSGNNAKKVVVLPDLTSLHGLTERSTPLVADGEQETPLTRTSGDLLRYFITAFNGLDKQFDPLAWTVFFLQYGGNQKPLYWSQPKLLVERNTRDYLKRIDVTNVAGGKVHFAVLDTMLDDSLRDAIRPMALSELKAIVGIPTEPEAKSTLRSAQETLYPSGV